MYDNGFLKFKYTPFFSLLIFLALVTNIVEAEFVSSTENKHDVTMLPLFALLAFSVLVFITSAIEIIAVSARKKELVVDNAEKSVRFTPKRSRGDNRGLMLYVCDNSEQKKEAQIVSDKRDSNLKTFKSFKVLFSLLALSVITFFVLTFGFGLYYKLSALVALPVFYATVLLFDFHVYNDYREAVRRFNRLNNSQGDFLNKDWPFILADKDFMREDSAFKPLQGLNVMFIEEKLNQLTSTPEGFKLKMLFIALAELYVDSFGSRSETYKKSADDVIELINEELDRIGKEVDEKMMANFESKKAMFDTL